MLIYINEEEGELSYSKALALNYVAYGFSLRLWCMALACTCGAGLSLPKKGD
jgi:hypothetical protein